MRLCAATYMVANTFFRVKAEWPRAIEELVSFPHIEEAAVLSTCNRMELYVVALSWHRVRLTCRPVSALLQTPVSSGKGTTVQQ